MKCPVCPDSILTMSDRQGVEIDYCPQCRGVWLDRGELDKLLERAAAPAMPAAAPRAPQHQESAPDHRGQSDSGYGRYGRSDDGYRKKKSWLNEIFD